MNVGIIFSFPDLLIINQEAWHDNMYSYKVLSELGNGSLETFADTRLVASDGASVHHQGASVHQQAEAEAGKLPLGLVAAPAPLSEAELSVLNLSAAVSEAELTSPAVGASSDCVIADFAEAETE